LSPRACCTVPCASKALPSHALFEKPASTARARRRVGLAETPLVEFTGGLRDPREPLSAYPV